MKHNNILMDAKNQKYMTVKQLQRLQTLNNEKIEESMRSVPQEWTDEIERRVVQLVKE